MAAIRAGLLAWFGVDPDLAPLSHVDAQVYQITWVHPSLTALFLLLAAVTLAVVAGGVWSGWRWTRTASVLSHVAAAYAAVLWAYGAQEVPLGLALALVAAGSALVLIQGPRARRWFDGTAFIPSPMGRAWANTKVRILAAATRIPLAPVALGLIALGVAARIATIWTMDLWADGATYSAMGHAWMRHGEFLMPWGDVTTGGFEEPSYSHHYPPLYPFYLGLVYKAFGFGVLQTKVAAVAVALAALAVAYACTRDLYGPRVALVVTAILASEPHLVWSAGTGFSENMVLLWFTLTIWGIAKSLEKPPYILAAGLAAAMAYLTRSSVGPFFLVAGVGGLLWRLRFQGWRALANGWYLAAAASFLAVFAWWANRNITKFGGWPAWDSPWSGAGGPGASLAHLGATRSDLAIALVAAVAVGVLFWVGKPKAMGLPPEDARRVRLLYVGAGVAAALAAVLAWAWMARNGAAHGWPPWETSTYTSAVNKESLQTLDLFGKGLLYKVPFFLLFFAWYAVPLAPEVRASWRRIRDEHESALWLAVALVFAISWVITAQFWVREKNSLFWFDNHRYVVIAFVPLLWAAFRRQDPDAPRLKLRSVLLTVTLATFMVFLFFAPVRYATTPAAQELDQHLVGGEVVAYDGASNKYLQYPYLRNDITMVGYWESDAECVGNHVDYVLAVNSDKRFHCYSILQTFKQRFWSGGVQNATIWKWDPPPPPFTGALAYSEFQTGPSLPYCSQPDPAPPDCPETGPAPWLKVFEDPQALAAFGSINASNVDWASSFVAVAIAGNQEDSSHRVEFIDLRTSADGIYGRLRIWEPTRGCPILPSEGNPYQAVAVGRIPDARLHPVTVTFERMTFACLNATT